MTAAEVKMDDGSLLEDDEVFLCNYPVKTGTVQYFQAFGYKSVVTKPAYGYAAKTKHHLPEKKVVSVWCKQQTYRLCNHRPLNAVSGETLDIVAIFKKRGFAHVELRAAINPATAEPIDSSKAKAVWVRGISKATRKGFEKACILTPKDDSGKKGKRGKGGKRK